MSLESTLTLITIAAHKKRDVATADIAGAYLNTDMDEDIYVKFTRSMMEIRSTSNYWLWRKEDQYFMQN